MVKIRNEQIDEIKYPHNQKNDNSIFNLNLYDNSNKHHIHNLNNVYEDKENSIRDFNLNVII